MTFGNAYGRSLPYVEYLNVYASDTIISVRSMFVFFIIVHLAASKSDSDYQSTEGIDNERLNKSAVGWNNIINDFSYISETWKKFIEKYLII